MTRQLIALALAALAAAACVGGPSPGTPTPSGSASASGRTPQILPILVSSEITKGQNRFLFSLTDRENKLIAAPDVPVHLRFYDVDVARDAVAFEADAEFLWSIEGRQGLYRASVNFPDSGRWGTDFIATLSDGRVETVRAEYDVVETSSTPALGAEAPSVVTPTLADVGGDVAQVSTDPEPRSRFYETSISSALEAGEPFVVAFATPLFCETQVCGPTLEKLKTVADEYPEVTFINVEPYVMTFSDGRLQPEVTANGHPEPAEWTTAWGLPSEPYTFVVAADGTVAAKFEGMFAIDELRAAIEAL